MSQRIKGNAPKKCFTIGACTGYSLERLTQGRPRKERILVVRAWSLKWLGIMKPTKAKKQLEKAKQLV